MIDELEVLKIVVEKLGSAGIQYMITGSVAANFYTTPRMTRDIDIVINIREKDAEKVLLLFLGDFYIDKDILREAIQQRGIFNIIHNEGIVKVDFIIRKDTEYRKTEFDRRCSIVFAGLTLYVTSPEDLILSKICWMKETMSEIQMRDVINLLRAEGLDMDYIEEWIGRLGLEEIFKKAKDINV